MASIQIIRNLLSDAKFELSGYDQNRIAEKTKQDSRFDYSAALASILKCGAERDAIIEAINSTKMLYCGYCHDGWIPILETKAWAQMERPVFTNTILVPQAMTPCPNCSMRKGDALKVLESQEPDAQGWSFALLFNFIRYTLGRSDIKPDQFTPSQYWPSLVWDPPISFAQMELMEWISAPSSVPMPRLPKNHRMAAVARNVQLRMEA